MAFLPNEPPSEVNDFREPFYTDPPPTYPQTKSYNMNPIVNIGLGFVSDLLKTGLQQHLYNVNTNKQNEYNSPANQYKRLEEAGFYPAGYGQQIASNNLSANYQTPNVRFERAQQYQQMQLQSQQLKNLQEDYRTKQLNNQGLYYDNLFKAQTLQTRVAQSFGREVMQQLQQQYLNGSISKQEYETSLARVRALYEENMSTYSPDRNPLDFNYWLNNGEQLSPRAFIELSKAWTAIADTKNKNIMSDIYGIKLESDRLHYNYESTFNLPWAPSSNLNVLFHLLHSLLNMVSPETANELKQNNIR